MSRDWAPFEHYLSEQHQIKLGYGDLFDFLENLKMEYNGKTVVCCTPKEMAIRRQFPQLGRLLMDEEFIVLYEKLSKIEGGLDLLHKKDDELAAFLKAGKVTEPEPNHSVLKIDDIGIDMDSYLIKWFTGKLDERFFHSDRNNKLFVQCILEEARELSGEQKRLYDAYKQEWYKSHGVSDEEVATLKNEYEADVAGGRYDGSFESYELEFGYHGGEVYVCFEEFFNNEALNNRASLLENFFLAQHITMSVDVKNGQLIAKDDEGNTWKDAKIYDFALNECLAFNEDGTLSDGLAAAGPYAERLKKDAKIYGVEITSIVKSVSSVLKDAQDRSAAADDNSHRHVLERETEKE